MPEISQNIALLRHCVEESANHRIKTSTDFTFLAGVIQERLGETVATSTLKRLWGYVDGYASTRESTLNILARFIGYPDWETFVSDYCEVDGVQSSHRVISTTLNINDLPVGSRLEITWNPNRRCLLEYQGEHRFVIRESENAKLKAGETFLCDRFMEHEPLYVEHFTPDGSEELFVMGNKGGLTSVKVKP